MRNTVILSEDCGYFKAPSFVRTRKLFIWSNSLVHQITCATRICPTSISLLSIAWYIWHVNGEIILTVLCGAPLFSDPKRRPSGKLKSTEFCNYMPLSSRFKDDEKGLQPQESRGIASNIHKNQPSLLVKMYQVGIWILTWGTPPNYRNLRSKKSSSTKLWYMLWGLFRTFFTIKRFNVCLETRNQCIP